MSRGKVKSLKRLGADAFVLTVKLACKIYYLTKVITGLHKNIENLEKEVIFHMKEAHRLELRVAVLEAKLLEWKTEAEKDKNHLRYFLLTQETEKLLGGEIK
jgi:hypothetical protein